MALGYSLNSGAAHTASIASTTTDLGVIGPAGIAPPGFGTPRTQLLIVAPSLGDMATFGAINGQRGDDKFSPANAIFGQPAVQNAAQDIRPPSFNEIFLQPPVVADSNQYYAFNFVDADPSYHAINFAFGTTQMITKAGFENKQAWGFDEGGEIETPLPIWTQSFGNLVERDRWGGIVVLRDIDYSNFYHNFTEPYAYPPLDVNFPFGPGLEQLILPQGRATHLRDEQTVYGDTTVQNVAQDIRPSGIEPRMYVQGPVVFRDSDTAYINFHFDSGYVPPNAANIGYYFAGDLRMDMLGTSFEQHGLPTVYNLTQIKNVQSITPTTAFGTAYVWKYHAYIYVPTSDFAGTGASATLPKVFNWRQDIRVGAFSGQPPAIPTPKIYNKLQFLRPSSVVLSEGYGSTRVSNQYRWIYPVGKATSNTFGTTKVGTRRTFTDWKISADPLTTYGFAFVAYRVRYIDPPTKDHNEFGTPLVRDRAQTLRPGGTFFRFEFGTPAVYDPHFPQTLICTTSYEEAIISNGALVRLQYRFVYPTGEEHTLYQEGRYAVVYNRNRTLVPLGWESSRLPPARHDVYNNARLLVDERATEFLAFGTVDVSNYYRHVYPESNDLQAVLGTPVVKNARLIIDQNGWGVRSSRVGQATKVVDTTQRVYTYQQFDYAEYGKPFVDFHTRYIVPWEMPFNNNIGVGFVAYRVREITPAGIPPGFAGATTQLTIRKMILSPFSTVFTTYGTPEIRNLTPEIRVNQFKEDAYGKPRVELYRRYVYVPYQSNTVVQFGRPYVAMRIRRLIAFGWAPVKVGTPRIQFDQTEYKPPNQVITAGGMSFLTVGTAHYLANIKQAILNATVGLEFSVGTAYVREQSILPFAMFKDYPFGSPKVLGGMKLISGAGGLYQGGVGSTRVIRMGTQEIYPGWPFKGWEQYLEPSDTWLIKIKNQRPRVELKHRVIKPSPSFFNLFGSTRAFNKEQYIYATGIAAHRRGWHDVYTAHDETIWVQGIPKNNAFGVAKASTPPYTGPKWIYPTGNQYDRNSTGTGSDTNKPLGAVGRPYLEKQHREVYVNGSLMTLFSTPCRYVGPKLRIYANGKDQALYGEKTFVADRIRTITQRYNVDGRPGIKQYVRRNRRWVEPFGVAAPAMDKPVVKLQLQYIKAWGIDPPYNSPTRPTVGP